MYPNGIPLNHTQIENIILLFHIYHLNMYYLWKLLFGIFSYTNSSLPKIIVIESNYAALKATYIDYEEEVASGGMVEGSWSIGDHGSPHAYECSGIAGATDC